MKKVLNIVAVVFVLLAFVLIAAYYRNNQTANTTLTAGSPINPAQDNADSLSTGFTKKEIVADTIIPRVEIDVKNVSVDSILNFAETLIGTPYKYASINPDSGFDCSGFITYVFNHFNIKVPRSSIDFTNAGKEIPVQQARKGDLILFSGTDSTEKFVGHMGIITQNNNEDLQFIHSSSGKAKGVVITPMSDYYKKRFVKVVRMFPSTLAGRD